MDEGNTAVVATVVTGTAAKAAVVAFPPLIPPIPQGMVQSKEIPPGFEGVFSFECTQSEGEFTKGVTYHVSQLSPGSASKRGFRHVKAEALSSSSSSIVDPHAESSSSKMVNHHAAENQYDARVKMFIGMARKTHLGDVYPPISPEFAASPLGYHEVDGDSPPFLSRAKAMPNPVRSTDDPPSVKPVQQLKNFTHSQKQPALFPELAAILCQEMSGQFVQRKLSIGSRTEEVAYGTDTSLNVSTTEARRVFTTIMQCTFDVVVKLLVTDTSSAINMPAQVVTIFDEYLDPTTNEDHAQKKLQRRSGGFSHLFDTPPLIKEHERNAVDILEPVFGVSTPNPIDKTACFNKVTAGGVGGGGGAAAATATGGGEEKGSSEEDEEGAGAAVGAATVVHTASTAETGGGRGGGEAVTAGATANDVQLLQGCMCGDPDEPGDAISMINQKSTNFMLYHGVDVAIKCKDKENGDFFTCFLKAPRIPFGAVVDGDALLPPHDITFDGYGTSIHDFVKLQVKKEVKAKSKDSAAYRETLVAYEESKKSGNPRASRRKQMHVALRRAHCPSHLPRR